jgi:hypothetical protein
LSDISPIIPEVYLTSQDHNRFISLLMDSEVDGHRLTDREIHAFCQLQFGAGFETTADAMSITLHYLAIHPEVRQPLAASPDLLPGAVEEFLRYATPTSRYLTFGSGVRLCYQFATGTGVHGRDDRHQGSQDGATRHARRHPARAGAGVATPAQSGGGGK